MEFVQIENIMLRFMIVIRAYYGTRVAAVFHDSLSDLALNATINGYLSVCLFDSTIYYFFHGNSVDNPCLWSVRITGPWPFYNIRYASRRILPRAPKLRIFIKRRKLITQREIILIIRWSCTWPVAADILWPVAADVPWPVAASPYMARGRSPCA